MAEVLLIRYSSLHNISGVVKSILGVNDLLYGRARFLSTISLFLHQSSGARERMSFIGKLVYQTVDAVDTKNRRHFRCPISYARAWHLVP